MAKNTAPAQRVRALYDALEERRSDALPAFFAETVRFHTIRPMPPTSYRNRAELFRYLAEVERTMPEDGNIRLQQLAADGEYVFAIHLEAQGTPREHRHMMVYRVDGETIVEAWELTLAEAGADAA